MWKSSGLKRLFLQAKQQRTSGADINSGDEKQNISKGPFFSWEQDKMRSD